MSITRIILEALAIVLTSFLAALAIIDVLIPGSIGLTSIEVVIGVFEAIKDAIQ